MAYEFNKDSAVLYYAPKPHVRWERCQFILWPAWAYRVVAPRKRDRKLNVFQRAVMGLCMAGTVSHEAISKHLDIHKDLAAFILKELMDCGYMNPNGLPTELGRKTLEDDAVDSHDMVAGFVFQDPWSLELWPRFVNQMNYCELSFREDGFPDLLLGSKGEPKPRRAFMILPQNHNDPQLPDVKDILSAVSRHSRDMRSRSSSDNEDQQDYDESVSDDLIQRVSFIDERPQPIYLTTFLYIPEQASDVIDWYSCDPFGFGRSSYLRRKYETVMNNQPELQDVLVRLVKSTVQGGYEDMVQLNEMLRLEAESVVDQYLTVNIRSYGFYESLINMAMLEREVHLSGNTSPKYKINDALRAGSKVLEACFKEMATAYPLGDVWHKVYVENKKSHWVQQTEKDLVRSTYESAFRNVGFSGSVPEPFIKVKPGQIRSVAEFGNVWQLRPCVTATVLQASLAQSHPLREIAKEYPGILETLNSVADVGGAAGHESDRDFSIEDVTAQIERVFMIVKGLMKYLPATGAN